MAKINVLYLITKATTGGAQKYVYDLATNLPKTEFDVIVAYGQGGKLARDLAAADIKLHEMPTLARNVALVADVRSFVRMLTTFRELHPDVIHLNSSKAAGLGALAARLTRVPRIIFTVHGWPFKEQRGVIARAFIYLASWVTALLSHKVIVVSKNDERIASRMWGIRGKVRYVPLGSAPFFLAPPEEGYRRMFGVLSPAPLRSTTVRIISIAELNANKGLPYAIDAVAELAKRGVDAVYVVVGEGEERASLAAYAKRRGIDDRVFFPGFIENAAHNLLGFDIFVLPSVKEGMPYVLLEAARAGIPIVATEVIDEEFAARIPNMRLVRSRDTTALADAIGELSKMSRMNAKRDDLFPLTTMLRETFSLYTS